MGDLVYVGVLVAFFALAALFVKGCERLVGTLQSDVEASPEPGPVDTDTEVAA